MYVVLASAIVKWLCKSIRIAFDWLNMILRLPQFAEREFAKQCSIYGALCHKAGEDENGWDYLVEFRRNKTVPGPADTQPPAQSAYVQIKSLGRGRPTCSIKLSNALKAAQSRQPWFIVLVMPGADQRPKSMQSTFGSS
jgi:hypothetical protein